MTPTLTNVLGGFAPKLEALTRIQSVLSMVIIPFFAWFNFNTWAGNNFEVTLNNPPRHFTTFLRYTWYALLYAMIIEFVYIIILVTPGLFNVIIKQSGVTPYVDPATTTFQRDFPLWLLVFLISIVPNTPGLRKVEQWIRTKLHHKAFIPAEAEALVNQFIMHPARFESDPDSTRLVMEAISDDIPYTHDVMRPDKRLRHRWFKMSYLYKQINGWKEKREIIQFYSLCEPILKDCKKEYEDLQLDVRSYYMSKQQLGKNASENELKHLDVKKADINKKLDLLLKKAYKVISCGVLATQKTHKGRIDAFRNFGLNPDIIEGPQVYVDIILSCVFLTTAITFLTTYFFHLMDPKIIKDMPTVISWTVIMLFLQGTSIMAAVFLYRRLSMKDRLGGDRGKATFVIGPRTDISIGAATGYLTGLAILMMYVVIFDPKEFKGLINLIGRVWPWAFIPATTSGFVIYYLYSLDVSRKRIAEGLIQGGCMGVVAILAYIISMGLQRMGIDRVFLSYCVLVCGLTGFAVGWTFPEEYRRRKKADVKSYDRRIQPRISVINTGTLLVGKKAYPCQTVDVSMEGARLSTVTPDEVGTNVLLNLNDIGAIKGVIKRKEEEKTYLQFISTNEIRKLLENYINPYSASLAYGSTPVGE